MRSRVLLLMALGLLTQFAFAQNETDVLRYSQTYMKGSARFTAMGGAFGALGGDVSSIMVNPAGVAVYRTSEFVFSTGINNTNLNTDYRGSNTYDNLTRVNIGNTGIVIPVYMNNSSPIRNFNLGISYNRVNDYNMNALIHTNDNNFSGGYNTSSMMDYFRDRTSSSVYYNPKLTTGVLEGSFDNLSMHDWKSKLAWNSFLIDPVNKTDVNNELYRCALDPSDLVYQDQIVDVRGFNDLVNLSFGGNVMDVVYFGGSFNITNIKFHSVNTISETNVNGSTSDFKYFNYDQIYDAFATGYSLSLGVILKPIQELRIGLSYQSPTWTFVDEYYAAYMNSNYNPSGTATPDYPTYSYRVNTPQRLTGSVAAVIGNFVILSADVDWVGYSSMKLRLRGADSGSSYEKSVNSNVNSDFRDAVNFRVGTEFRLTNSFSVRGGYQYYQNPYKDGIITDHPVNFYSLADGYNNSGSTGINKPINVYSAGIGYRTRSFFIDFAYSQMRQKNSYSLYDYYDSNNNNASIVDTNNPNLYYYSGDVYSGTATQTIRKNSYMLTLGFKF